MSSSWQRVHYSRLRWEDSHISGILEQPGECSSSVHRKYSSNQGELGRGGIIFKGIEGIEEKEKVGCVDMIFEGYKHNSPMVGAKFIWSKIDRVHINQLVCEVVVLFVM